VERFSLERWQAEMAALWDELTSDARGR
jgi:hypothetical protein